MDILCGNCSMTVDKCRETSLNNAAKNQNNAQQTSDPTTIPPQYYHPYPLFEGAVEDILPKEASELVQLFSSTASKGPPTPHGHGRCQNVDGNRKEVPKRVTWLNHFHISSLLSKHTKDIFE